MKIRLGVIALIAAGCLAACGGGGGGGGPSTPPGPRQVQISWAANHEKGVNSAGGGYTVSITGQPPINVPWVTGPTAPTSTSLILQQGTYTITVTAYAALDAQGGATGSTSAPAQQTIAVP